MTCNRIERRHAAELQPASPRQLVGYAAVFDAPSQDLGGFVEIVRPGAFTRSLASDNDVCALVHHLPQLVLGRTSARTLQLTQDRRGLRFEIELPETTTARDLMVSVERGDVRGASFAFTVAPNGDRWTQRDGKTVRELVDVDIHDVTVTALPAYLDTTVALRALQGFHPAWRRKSLERFLETC